VVDLVILMIIAGLTFFLQFGLLGGFLEEMTAKFGESLTTKNLIILVVGGLLAVVGVWIVIKKTAIGGKVKHFIKGLWDGLKTIFTMKKKWSFLLHTVIIWVCYLTMFYVCFFAMAETSNLPIAAMFAAFVLGSVAIIIVPGGIGAYPAMIATAIALYDPSAEIAALGLGWIIWASQTALNIVGGGTALLFAPNPVDKTDDDAAGQDINLQNA